MKSAGTSLRSQKLTKSSIHSLFAVAGPPTRNAESIFLDRLGGVTIELEVIALRAVPERSQVRFVPYFEEPLAYFTPTVALDAV